METWKLSGGGPARANTTINETMGYNTVGEGVNGTRTNTATWNFRGGGYEDNQLRVRGGYTHHTCNNQLMQWTGNQLIRGTGHDARGGGYEEEGTRRRVRGGGYEEEDTQYMQQAISRRVPNNTTIK